jgi:hypothetical protein
MADEGYGLTWTIRRSFLDYLSSLADGRAVLGRGATVSPPHGVTFPPRGAEIDAATGIGGAWFTGDVRFTAHHGLLQVVIADPRLDLRQGTGTITISTGTVHLAMAEFSVEYAHVGGDGRWRAYDVRLTESGAALFGGAYLPGDTLDPFTTVVALATVDPHTKE